MVSNSCFDNRFTFTGSGGWGGVGGVVIGHGDKDRYSMTLWEREGRGHSASSNNENLSCVRLSHVSLSRVLVKLLEFVTSLIEQSDLLGCSDKTGTVAI